MHTDTAKDVQASGKRTRAAWYTADLGYMAVEFAVPLYLTPWMVTDLGVPATLFGLALAISSWTVALSGPYIGVRADERLTRRRWYGASAAIAGILLGLIYFLPHDTSGPIVALVLLVSLGVVLLVPISSTIVSEMAPEELRGRYMGAWTLVWIGGLALGPTLGGIAMDDLGARGACLLILATGLLGSVLFALQRVRPAVPAATSPGL